MVHFTLFHQAHQGNKYSKVDLYKLYNFVGVSQHVMKFCVVFTFLLQFSFVRLSELCLPKKICFYQRTGKYLMQSLTFVDSLCTELNQSSDSTSQLHDETISAVKQQLYKIRGRGSLRDALIFCLQSIDVLYLMASRTRL